MAEYVVVDKEQLETDLGIVCDAIREKGGTSEQLAFPNGMKEAVMGIQSGGENPLKYAVKLDHVFNTAVFPTGTELELNLENITSLTYGFYKVKGVKKITLIASESDVTVNCNSAFWSDANGELETIDLSGFKRTFNNTAHMFRDCKKLKYIYGEMDVSACKSFPSMFLGLNLVEEVRFKKESIFFDLDMSYLSNLSDMSIQSSIDGLADLTGQTSHIIVFHSTVKAKLTDEQKTQIASKNWILA